MLMELNHRHAYSWGYIRRTPVLRSRILRSRTPEWDGTGLIPTTARCTSPIAKGQQEISVISCISPQPSFSSDVQPVKVPRLA